MTEIVIDPATGLPELPENHFWEVERSDHHYGWVSGGYYGAGFYEYEGEAYLVTIKERATRTETKEVKSKNPSWHWWNSEPEYLYTTEAKEVEREIRVARKRVVRIKDLSELTEREEVELRARLNLTIDELDASKDSWNDYATTPARAIELMDFSLTEESILRTAKEVYAEFIEDQEREAKEKADRERIDKLVGAYPPKSLVVA
ncbi:hypothetical protein AUR04nite_00130 [Glutamicibacter uratoxydans]|uniref:Uncharacterized protein n=1 Tax=Glutamicibacter uratoxydans TaxID=43667 RepID=A0A4Y4DPI4_GLUUR|nr:hypothetical protein [Glutamicibacter uratoxydans]GED04481.1 hypothetical protein AUR04nite_00130 [Glutamicibacter uratoxydans]